MASLNLSQLAPNAGARKKRRRLGIGEGSGHGKTSSRGQKGQGSRSGSGVPRGFEGGQMPLHRRLPKVGFTSQKKIRGENLFTPVALKKLVELSAGVAEISLETLYQSGLVGSRTSKIKILGGFEIGRKISVEAHAFSESARRAIEATGGEARVK
ncbi:50S ribosomal protein L15 [bacterium]|nr:50S ribosomal protein L15 [bacterium]